MAKLSNIMQIVSMFLIFDDIYPQNIDPVDKLKHAAFDCKLAINGQIWNMQCESETINMDAEPSKFYVVNLFGIFEPDKQMQFDKLIKSTSSSKFKFYMCESIWRPVVKNDPSVMIEHCSNYNKHLKKFLYIINPSFLTNIEIKNMSKPIITLSILEALPNLDEVRVCHNFFPNITVLPAYRNNSISSLILEMNKIENLYNGTFNNFPNLLSLDLSHNLLSNLDKNMFGDLSSILKLDLSFNNIKTFTTDVFSNMVALKNLYLQNNNLNNISEEQFQFNRYLRIVDISNNNLKTLPPTLFHQLRDLTNVTCAKCNLFELGENIFRNSPDLQYLDFSHNHIPFIPEGIFRNLKFLNYLALGFNNISEITRNMLQSHPYLRNLNLTQNNISSLKNGVFDGAPRILIIDLSKNKLEFMSDELVKVFPDLEYIDLRQNKISTVELGQTGNIYIRKILLSDNIISIFNVDWKKLLFLESVYVDNNRLTSLNLPPCIPSVKQTITFSFKKNNISSINLDSLLLDEINAKTDRRMSMCFFNGLAKNFVDIMHNPLFCDCSLYPFYKYIKTKSPRKYQLEMILNKDNLTCSGPDFLVNKTITSLTDDVFSCFFTDRCPESCTCGTRGKDNMTFVNCTASSLNEVPHTIPDETTVLYFNRNNLTTLLSLNGKEWIDLIELHLDSNLLSTLNGWNFPSSLRYLSVRGNKLKTLPSSLMNFIANQTNFYLYLGDNEKNCSCDREELKSFLIKNIDFIQDNENIVCKVTNNGTTAYLPLTSVPDSELCPRIFLGLNYYQKRIIISLCLFFTFLILMLLFYYKQRQLILSFFYIHCDELFRLCYSEDEYDQDKLFDAFIAYSSSDRNIVMELLQELEDNPPYFRLCIHERNWLPGRFICDNILSSVQSSKRIIIVLSNTFIKSQWFNLELRVAVSKMAKDKISRLIVVLVEKSVSLDTVDPELRHAISKRTYLVWKERWFWEKLRYAMPRKKIIKESTANRHRERTTSELALMPEAV